METQRLLRDRDIFPSEEVLQAALGKRYAAYRELIDTITDDDFGVTFEWRYYNDGKSWLGKAVGGKKTIFWLSVWEGFFRVGFYFTEKTRGGVMDLNIDDSIKATFSESEATSKLIPLLLNISKKKQLKDVLKIVQYKMTLK